VARDESEEVAMGAVAPTNAGPVFVAGLERTGTSLMFALLASHPRIAMTRRTNLWPYFYERYGDLGDPENFERCLDVMMRYKRLIPLAPDPDRIRHEFSEGEASYARLFALLEEHYAQGLGKPRWGDKSLNTERYAAEIFEAYPGATMLHMIRDPRDRYASALARWKTRRGGVGAGTAEWLSSLRLAKRNLKHYPDRYRIVRYETIVADPESTLREISAFIGEEYAPEMLTLSGAEKFRDEGSNSSYGRRHPGVISTDSIGRYAQVLSPAQITFIQMTAKAEMLEIGYSLDDVHLSPGERLRFSLASYPLDLARLVAWRARNAFKNRVGRDVPSYRLVETDS
jgi:hypothetical protein